MGEAIDTTQQLYPGLLDRNPNLLFTLKCRQFVEMVNGTDSEMRGPISRSPRSHHGSTSNSNRSSPSLSPLHSISGIGTASSVVGVSHFFHHHHVQQQMRGGTGSGSSSPSRLGKTLHGSSAAVSSQQQHQQLQQHLTGNQLDNLHTSSEDIKNAANSSLSSSERYVMNGSGSVYIENEDMEMSDCIVEDGILPQGNSNSSTSVCMNGNSHSFAVGENDAEEMGMWFY